VILISDGETHTGNASDLIDTLNAANIRIFTIGVGTQEGELIQTSQGFIKDAQGRVVKSRLNERELESIARQTGGFYVRSAPGDFGLERIYHEGIAHLQKEEQDERMSRIWTERFPLFISGALLLLLLEALLPSARKGATP
jgi:Ca-activated chloride channel family protein